MKIKVKHWLGVMGLICLALLVLLIVPQGAKLFRDSTQKIQSRFDLGPGRIAVLPITGEIVDSGWTVKWLKRYAEDIHGVKAVVIALDTPGGGVAPSQEICQAISRLRDSGVVVIASMGSIAASGGYYVASACDEIIANPGTITGSIGVISQFFGSTAQYTLHAAAGQIRQTVGRQERETVLDRVFEAESGCERRRGFGFDHTATGVAECAGQTLLPGV